MEYRIRSVNYRTKVQLHEKVRAVTVKLQEVADDPFGFLTQEVVQKIGSGERTGSGAQSHHARLLDA